jgi:hypothetical protein
MFSEDTTPPIFKVCSDMPASASRMGAKKHRNSAKAAPILISAV